MSEGGLPTIQLLSRARQGDAEALGQLLEAFRPELERLARHQLDGRVALRVAASDVIQQTFLEAYRCFRQFQGASEGEWAAWLHRILDNQVAGAVRDHALLKKRDVRKERPMDDSGGSQAGLKESLDAGHSSPSRRAIRGEEELRLLAALATLPPDQREAVRLRHLENRPLAEIAHRLNRTPNATASLIKRGLQALRKALHADE
jgi:RNA polymerase sigma-70 factor (ECF subfamily)